MVDATVSMVLEKLAPMIEKTVRDEVCLLIISTGDHANKLSKKLKIIQEVLGDAERKIMTDPKVKSWLHKLQDISYDIDNVLDEWDWKNVNLQMEDGSETSLSHPWVKKVSSFLKSVHLCFRQVVERRNINLNIKQLNERLDSIHKQNEDEFNFNPNVSRVYQEFRRISSTSFVNVREVHGRDDAKKALVRKLLSYSKSSNQIENGVQIISVVGAGGVGKTTLAQLVLSDDQIKDNFHEKIWVCVSNPFDEIKIAKALLEALKKETSHLSQFEAFLQRLAEAISGKKFLLVLDDVWTEDDTMWKQLKSCLENNGSPGSKILVTTRKSKVAQVMGSNQMQIQSLEPLSDSICWSILSQIALNGRTQKDCEILKETGLKIVKKCKGLPLAAKVIGSLLRGKRRLKEWQNVLKSQVWEIEIARTEISPFLVLSYDELQPVAKRCFSYCAIFPKDSEIDVDNLVRMWCAQGFVSSNGGSDDVEIKGRKIFDDLAMRSFFQDFKMDSLGDNIIKCKMHDIVHDFAQFLTENECLIVENIGVGDKLANVQNVCHLNLLLYKVEDDKNHIPMYYEKCRSFLLSTEYGIHTDLVGNLIRVRVLVLYRCELKRIPSEIGNLIHLRYLDLSKNRQIEDLPETTCDLYNLQTLIIEECYRLCRLPQGIHKLRNLRHLLNYGMNNGAGVIEFPEGIKELKNLWTLSHIRASRKNLELLSNLNHLRGSLSLHIEDLEEANDIVAVEKADLKSKNFIRELILHCITQYQVIEALQPHPNLQSLIFTTSGYIPKWIATITGLRKITITVTPLGYQNISSLPALANLPLLEDLRLSLEMKRMVSHELLGLDSMAPTQSSYAFFPKLKRLHFVYWAKWEEWEDISEEEENNIINISIFPCLEVLKLIGCPKLKTLPHRLLRKAVSSSSSSLKHVQLNRCDNLLIRYNDLEGVSQDLLKTSYIPISYFREVV